ncbi:unnamed protein product [Urochloa humidicola]
MSSSAHAAGGANKGSTEAASLLLGLPRDAPAEDIEYLLGDLRRERSLVESKRAALQDQIAAAASRRGGKRRAHHPPAGAPRVVPAAAADDDDLVGACTSRKGRGAVRRRLRAAAAGAKKERKRLEAVCGDLEEALVDAREMLALRGGGTA